MSPFNKGLLAALIFSVGICFSHLAQGGLSVDSIRYASIASHVNESGEVFNLYDEYSESRYANKPPWLFWAVALSYRVLGFSTFASKLPGAFIAFLGLMALWRMLRREYGERTAFLGLFLVAANPIFFRAVADLTFEGLVLAGSICCIDTLLGLARGASARWLPFGLGLVLMVLSKPPFIIIPILALAALLLQRQALRCTLFQPGFWVQGVLPAVVCGSWYLFQDAAYLSDAVHNQLFRPFEFQKSYSARVIDWGRALLLYLPLLIGTGISAAWWIRDSKLRRTEDLMLMVWALPGAAFVLFATVRAPYLLPSAVALAVFSARVLGERAPLSERMFQTIAAGGGIALLIVVGLAGAPISRKNPFVDALRSGDGSLDGARLCLDGKRNVDSRPARRRARMAVRLYLGREEIVYSSDSLPILKKGQTILAEGRCRDNLLKTGAFAPLGESEGVSLLKLIVPEFITPRSGIWDDLPGSDEL